LLETFDGGNNDQSSADDFQNGTMSGENEIFSKE
jgi:hypothetical protein